MLEWLLLFTLLIRALSLTLFLSLHFPAPLIPLSIRLFFFYVI